MALAQKMIENIVRGTRFFTQIGYTIFGSRMGKKCSKPF